jgi:hypothetical protein
MADYRSRACEIAQSYASDDVDPKILIGDAANLCKVTEHNVLVTYAYRHPAEGGKFSVRIEVSLPIGRGQRIQGDGHTPGEAIVALGNALGRFMDGES